MVKSIPHLFEASLGGLATVGGSVKMTLQVSDGGSDASSIPRYWKEISTKSSKWAEKENNKRFQDPLGWKQKLLCALSVELHIILDVFVFCRSASKMSMGQTHTDTHRKHPPGWVLAKDHSCFTLLQDQSPWLISPRGQVRSWSSSSVVKPKGLPMMLFRALFLPFLWYRSALLNVMSLFIMMLVSSDRAVLSSSFASLGLLV